MKNIKNKMLISASIMALADLAAIGIMGYIAFSTMNLIAWVIILLLAMIFAYDVSKALKFIINLLKY